MSLIPLREALRALAGEGLVTYRPRRGYVVTELDLAELEEVYRLRRLLETDALRRGVGRATAADLHALEAAADACGTRPPRPGTSPASSPQTGASTTACTRSPAAGPMARLIGLLWDSTEAYRALYFALPGEAAEADRAHRAIIAAVAAADAAEVVALQDAHRGRALTCLRNSPFGDEPGLEESKTPTRAPARAGPLRR